MWKTEIQTNQLVMRKYTTDLKEKCSALNKGQTPYYNITIKGKKPSDLKGALSLPQFALPTFLGLVLTGSMMVY